MFKLDMQSRTPIYQQLKRRITELILLGAVEAGEPLPSVRNMARELGVNPNTVSKAYQDLEREGVIYSVVGKGSFIAGSDEFGRQVKVSAINRLRDCTAEAKLSGVPILQVMDIVRAVYNEDKEAK